MQLQIIARWLSVAGLAAAAEYDYIIVGGGPSVSLLLSVLLPPTTLSSSSSVVLDLPSLLAPTRPFPGTISSLRSMFLVFRRALAAQTFGPSTSARTLPLLLLAFSAVVPPSTSWSSSTPRTTTLTTNGPLAGSGAISSLPLNASTAATLAPLCHPPMASDTPKAFTTLFLRCSADSVSRPST